MYKPHSYEEVLAFETPSFRIVDMSKRKANDDGYRGIHLYFQRDNRIDTVRLNLLRIAARIVHSARYIFFKLCSHCPFETQYRETLDNIQRLQPTSATA